MTHEPNTVSLVREILTKKGYYKNKKIIVEEQKSKNLIVKKFLKHASKKTEGKGSGKPEFIIRHKDYPKIIEIIECKGDPYKHISKNQDNPLDYAVDGVLHYAKHLKEGFEVVALGISGETKEELKISNYFITKEKNIEWKEEEILSFEEYEEKINPLIEATEEEIMKFAGKLHNDLRDFIKLTEQEKPLIVSGSIIALINEPFKKSYESYETEKKLAKAMVNAIKEQLTESNINTSKIDAMMNPYSFIATHEILTKKKKEGEFGLIDIIRSIDKKLIGLMKKKIHLDVVGRFYGEFLKYTGGDKKGLGIVLTPGHITELFAELAQLTKDDVIIDTCCGTGAFLISAMCNMIDKSKGNKNKIKHIGEHQLIGIEQQPKMFALAASNMLFRGDGRANLQLGNCFEVTKQSDFKKYKPTVGLINPPYSQKGEGLSELHFVKNMLDSLEKNGKGIAIVPISCAIGKNKLKEEILKKHTLEAVMSVPEELFYPVGVVTCIMIFTAKKEHPKDYESWFGYWRDDGFIKTKNKGRIDYHNNWENLKKEWLDMFINKKEIPGKCVKKKVTFEDEWCAEAYMETDYSEIDDSLFREHFKKNKFFELFYVNLQEKNKPKKIITKLWKQFKYKDLFEIKRGKSKITTNIAKSSKGKTLFISASTRNNGVIGTVELESEYKGNVITIANAGQGSVGFSFYQPYPFCATSTVNILTPKFKMNKYIGNFLTTLIQKERPRFSFGRGWNYERLYQSKIKLPVDKQGNPDWKFMEDYIKSLKYSKGI